MGNQDSRTKKYESGGFENGQSQFLLQSSRLSLTSNLENQKLTHCNSTQNRSSESNMNENECDELFQSLIPHQYLPSFCIWDIRQDSQLSLLQSRNSIRQLMSLQSLQIIGQLPTIPCGLLQSKYSFCEDSFFGIGFQINNNQILTSSHNCYNRFYSEKAQKIVYYPIREKMINLKKGITITQLQINKQFFSSTFPNNNHNAIASLGVTADTSPFPPLKIQYDQQKKLAINNSYSYKFEIKKHEKEEDNDINLCCMITKIEGSGKENGEECEKLAIINGSPLLKEQNGKISIIGLCEGTRSFSLFSYEHSFSWDMKISLSSGSTKNQDQIRRISILEAIGKQLYEKKDLQKALIIHNRSRILIEATLGRNHMKWATNEKEKAKILYELGQFQDSEDSFLEVTTIYEKSMGKYHHQYLECLNYMGNISERVGNKLESLHMFERSLEIAEKIYGKQNSKYATILTNVGNGYKKMKKYEEAYYRYSKSIEIRKRIGQELTLQQSITLQNIGNLFGIMEQYEEALTCQRQSLKVRINLKGENHPECLNISKNILKIREKMGATSSRIGPT